MSFVFPTPEDTMEFGRSLGRSLRAGDLVLLAGPLGAGKTTLTRGIADGLGVGGRVSSPTFVLARVHPAGSAGVPLVHVDAYRLGGDLSQLDDLDLDTDLERSAIVVEWGEGSAERLSEDYLVVRLDRREDDVREITLEPHGTWADRTPELAQA
ncbi:tRNA (adenosine(37)-N6)-threonylcarbamoyltransferase complex ATPase subunit type 1 TsaE [Amycolatopsis mediterranei]|uniref:tRNA threonylcarbamoyladenosine biosynthesis protein TsaE n=1 Tax=Amycolatopsis mediterranei (strain S699) TaxID=713604 RepID=A0A9R0NRF8_AMYMS|nr:tRNA (adenosine(37)-N6)-threonylcarbamoyltransferase complex ATPase subunit type 1 TsaE [Amycolatopsis mediterranei]AEK39250.1 ATP/GTP-binding protein [Amycolatopsis mediterranei S699]KDO09857.1 ATP-binding protein [Amycolatopsis mediterranei]KDU86269.1 ATP-binding protein [Amycolatopsis mediterranei]UZF67730.1 tRNA (adenosine(37)-N6)-threonylcarbamoyltransferase complex ATPase subunit type 1 TsaE [Amycolatopsis mediterranei]